MVINKCEFCKERKSEVGTFDWKDMSWEKVILICHECNVNYLISNKLLEDDEVDFYISKMINFKEEELD